MFKQTTTIQALLALVIIVLLALITLTTNQASARSDVDSMLHCAANFCAKTRVKKIKYVRKRKRGKVRYSWAQAKILASAKRFGVPRDLALAIAKQESGYRCHIRGRVGEVGPLQIRPSSARGLGYRGSRSKLYRNCNLQVYYGMKHLAVAWRKAKRVCKKPKWCAAYMHNAGYGVKSYRIKMARKYANSVMRLRKRV